MAALQFVVADPNEIVRKGICALIRERPGWKVAAEARDGREAVEITKQVNPEVTILDFGMPLLNGVDAARQILKSGSRTKVLILTTQCTDLLIQGALEAGVRAYLLKSDRELDFISAVEALHYGKTFFTPTVAEMVLNGYLGRNHKIASDAVQSEDLRLTNRQREIVQLISEGNSSKEVAVILGISVKTAETHRGNIMQKIDCHSVAGLVRYAIRNHIIEA